MKTWLRTHPSTVLRGSFTLVFVLMVVGGVYVFQQIYALSHHSSRQDDVITKLADSLDATRSQLKNHGIAPSAPPADQIIREVPGSQGPTGPRGEQGASVTGPMGAQGPVGPSGAPGAPGTNGNDGRDGADGQAGAQGAQGPAGPAGATGATGQTGPQGPKGDPGDPGSAPSTYTFHWNGTTFLCTRTGDTGSSFDCVEQAPAADSASRASYVSRSGENGGSDGGILVAIPSLYAVVHERKYV